MSNFGLVPFRRRSLMTRPHNLVDSFFNDDFFKGFFSVPTEVSRLKVDVRDEEEKYVIEADLPGVKKEDISIDIDDGVLTLSAQSSEEKNEDNDNYVYRERRFGSVCRSFSLKDINDENIEAQYKDGVLTIDLPKNEPAKKLIRTVEIK